MKTSIHSRASARAPFAFLFLCVVSRGQWRKLILILMKKMRHSAELFGECKQFGPPCSLRSDDLRKHCWDATVPPDGEPLDLLVLLLRDLRQRPQLRQRLVQPRLEDVLTSAARCWSELCDVHPAFQAREAAGGEKGQNSFETKEVCRWEWTRSYQQRITT